LPAGRVSLDPGPPVPGGDSGVAARETMASVSFRGGETFPVGRVLRGRGGGRRCAGASMVHAQGFTQKC